jgi:hypothetical protein
VEKTGFILFFLSLLFIALALISLVFLHEFLYYGIFLSLSLGTAFFRRSKGMIIVSTGLFVCYIPLLEPGIIMLFYAGILIMVFGFLVILLERRKTRIEIKRILLEKGLIQRNSKVKISITENPRYIPLSRRIFGTFFNPTKMTVVVEVGGDRKLFFYDFSRKKLFETDESLGD